MTTKNRRKDSQIGQPQVVGLGLVALDHVTDQQGVRLHTQAGGTCGNVLTILAALGWHSSPIARLKSDRAGRWVRADLHGFGVDTRWVSCHPESATPVIIEKLLQDSTGVPFHCFSFCCPNCGARLPRYQPVTLTALSEIVSEAAKADVAFIDRFSASAVEFAQQAYAAGALVFFEPSRFTCATELKRILPFTHVFKYSHERLDEPAAELPDSVFLEIQTLGRGGLRFRTRSTKTGRLTPWMLLKSVPVETVIDSAGAGDWLSAGLIHLLCSRGVRKAAAEAETVAALSKAQQLAAWSCTFLGARGAMYHAPIDKISEILNRAHLQVPTAFDKPASASEVTLACDTCLIVDHNEETASRPEPLVLSRTH
jgi:hypothetical protein